MLRLGNRIPIDCLATKAAFLLKQITTADPYSTADGPNSVAQLSQNPCCTQLDSRLDALVFCLALLPAFIDLDIYGPGFPNWMMNFY